MVCTCQFVGSIPALTFEGTRYHSRFSLPEMAHFVARLQQV